MEMKRVNGEWQQVIPKPNMQPFIHEYYNQYNWSIIPIPLGSKISILKWTPYQTQLPTQSEINEWFEQESNVAIITGKLSGLCVVDVDDITVEANVLLNKLPMTWTVETGSGGLHYYFKYPLDKELPNFVKKIPGIDFRGEGGYVIGAGSKHSSGTYYKWVYKTDSIADIAEFPYELFKDCFEDNGTSKQKIKEILSYEQIPQGQRNDSLYAIAQQLHSAFPKQKSLAWELFNAFAKMKCESTYLEAYQKGEIGAVFNSASKSDIAKEALIEHESLNALGSWTNPVDSETLAQMDFPPDEWIVEGLFNEQSVGMISGDPASYKTWIMLDMAIAISTGNLWLRKFKTIKKKVWIIDKESSVRKLNARIKMFDATGGKDLIISSDQRVIIHPDGKLWDELLKKAHEMGVGVIIMDSFRRFLPGSENDSEVTNRFFNNIFKCRAYGISVIFTHHHRKKVKDVAQDNTSMIRGSSDILSCLDTHLVLEKATDQARLKLTPNKIKDGEAPPAISITVEIDSNDKFQFAFEGEAKDFQFDKKLNESEKTARYILITLKKNPIGMERNELESHITDAGYSLNSFKQAISNLLKTETIMNDKKSLSGGGSNSYYTLNYGQNND
jgi:hypothetical protein